MFSAKKVATTTRGTTTGLNQRWSKKVNITVKNTLEHPQLFSVYPSKWYIVICVAKMYHFYTVSQNCTSSVGSTYRYSTVIILCFKKKSVLNNFHKKA
jgi:hypothetical protein